MLERQRKENWIKKRQTSKNLKEKNTLKND